MLSLPIPLPQSLPKCDGPLPPSYDLQDLIRDIKSYLGETSGIDAASVNAEYLISLVQKYVSNPDDWVQFFHCDPSKNYTRNAIENINSKANILLLVWNPGKGSPVHDHANAHCIMKVLAGELMETVYHAPETEVDKSAPLRLKSQTVHPMDAVTYISDDIGLHRVHNPSPNQVAVSLHLYTPPNAADYGYHIFDETTGKASFVPQARSFLKPETSECKA
ncbi:cysteine dioxygenase type I [Aspergillus steynii IBT 23096]|uniref:Cysteine dioxygenase n=1 Tax=Aspergillus steynii IBT 23096 TaxID=1392250 RepID=A0A2I2GAB0_9EURO|nr:cysteine dioxygenase type I [Aspergillus steynii IBT 23096]PLB49803.1 cysteine dioxygenase type I [Aspergillus steynii IBT 23096]